jgi:MFS family permease
MWRQARIAIIADIGEQRQRGRQVTGMVGTEAAGRLLGPALGGILAGWSIRAPFVVYAVLALGAILPSFFLVRETAPAEAKKSAQEKDANLSTGSLLMMLLNMQILAFFSAQLLASMARGVLWGGTLLLYAAYVYDASPQLLGILSTAVSVVGIPITLSAGYLMDRFGRKTTMVPGFTLIAAGLIFLGLSAHWRLSLVAFIVAFLWVHAAQSITSGSMQVLGADMAPATARGRFFGFWRLAGEIGHILSPALFAVLAEQVAYSVSFIAIGLCALAAAAIIGVQISETVGREKF